ncbi:MAG TPA: sigma factor-like helix-turn-helix DNA-binding protein [candidate division Zixibacteria bacterium]|nr:sigma factor-like helix-turn-helix DNA-binding protein [candidate division Zixibacteria bacterium]
MLIKQKKFQIERLHRLGETPFEETPNFNWRVVWAVRGALSRLSPVEREVVERFHFCSESCAEIGARQKIPEIRVSRILKQALRKLKLTLGPFAQKRFGIPAEAKTCRICLSEKRKAIEKLLKTKIREETWKRILRKLKTEFRIRTGARSLIRHWKEHPPGARKNPGESIA